MSQFDSLSHTPQSMVPPPILTGQEKHPTADYPAGDSDLLFENAAWDQSCGMTHEDSTRHPWARVLNEVGGLATCDNVTGWMSHLAFLRLMVTVPVYSDSDCDCDCDCDSVAVLSFVPFPCLFFLLFFCPTASCLQNEQIIAPPPPHTHNGEYKSHAACRQQRSREAKRRKRVSAFYRCNCCCPDCCCAHCHGVQVVQIPYVPSQAVMTMTAIVPVPEQLDVECFELCLPCRGPADPQTYDVCHVIRGVGGWQRGPKPHGGAAGPGPCMRYPPARTPPPPGF